MDWEDGVFFDVIVHHVMLFMSWWGGVVFVEIPDWAKPTNKTFPHMRESDA